MPESWAVIRAVVTSVDQCGEDSYLFLLDGYSLWLPKKIKGYVVYSSSRGIGPGGAATQEELNDMRMRWCGQR